MTSPDPAPTDATRLRREPPRFRRVAVRRVAALTSAPRPHHVRGRRARRLRRRRTRGERAAAAAGVGAGPSSSCRRGTATSSCCPTAAGPTIRTFTPRRFDATALGARHRSRDPRRRRRVAVGRVAAEPGARGRDLRPGPRLHDRPRRARVPARGRRDRDPRDQPTARGRCPRRRRRRCTSRSARPTRGSRSPRTRAQRSQWHDLPPGAPPGDALVAAVRAAATRPDARVWVAGEAAAVQRIRRYLFDELALGPRPDDRSRGYWKHGRAGTGDE